MAAPGSPAAAGLTGRCWLGDTECDDRWHRCGSGLVVRGRGGSGLAGGRGAPLGSGTSSRLGYPDTKVSTPGAGAGACCCCCCCPVVSMPAPSSASREYTTGPGPRSPASRPKAEALRKRSGT
eukprot:1175650-Prorocentrum_minimum.AAC.3